MSDAQIACTLSPEAIRAGRAGLLPGLAQRALTREETPDGYRLTFTATSENLSAIATTIAAERQCCRWLHIHLTVPPDGGDFTLSLTGPDGAAAFLAALFAL
jgi:hypothetical protein